MNLDGAKTTINVSAMNSVRKNKGDSSGYEHSQSTEEVNIKQDEGEAGDVSTTLVKSFHVLVSSISHKN